MASMTWTVPPPRGGHPYYMHDTIYAQPGALRLVMRPNAAVIEDAAERLRAMDLVVLCGIGTSWHAALVGELMLARVGGLGHRVRTLHSFELASYWPEPPARTGVVAVSHRGSKGFSQEALARAASQHGVTITLTGKDAADMGEAAFSLVTVDQESSEAHTASYTAALAVLASLAAAVGRDEAFAHALEPIPDQLALLLGQESWEELAARYGDRRRFWFVGGGPNTATAYEAALKMSETNYGIASGVNCEQFLHGAYAAMTDEDLLVLIAPPGPSRARCLDAAQIAKAIGTPVIALVPEDDRELAALAAETIALPEIDELLSPILAVVPLQLLAYHIAVVQGVNPDTMRTGETAYARAREHVSL
jgi:glucosamine--fructose-6-phosphate aminotransferase (isomerizing)